MLLENWSGLLRSRLQERFEDLTGGADTPDLPSGLRAGLLDALEQQDCHTALISCASAIHCGGEGHDALIPAVSVMMLEAALASHLPVIGLGGGNRVLLDHGEATALLVGDALIPMAFENISTAAEVERHSSLIIADAIGAVGVRGALDRLSMEASASNSGTGSGLVRSTGDAPLVPRESLARFAAVAGARVAAATPAAIDEMAQLGLELGRASGLPGLSGQMCSVFGLTREDLTAEARSLLRSAGTRIGDGPEDALLRLLLERAESSLEELDLLSGAS